MRILDKTMILSVLLAVIALATVGISKVNTDSNLVHIYTMTEPFSSAPLFSYESLEADHSDS